MSRIDLNGMAKGLLDYQNQIFHLICSQISLLAIGGAHVSTFPCLPSLPTVDDLLRNLIDRVAKFVLMSEWFRNNRATEARKLSHGRCKTFWSFGRV